MLTIMSWENGYKVHPNIKWIQQCSASEKKQWHNSWGGGDAGGQPDTSEQEISADLLGKERQGKRENGEEKKEN